MAIVTCPVCSYKYSDRLPECPQCAKVGGELKTLDAEKALEKYDRETKEVYTLSKKNIAIIVASMVAMTAVVALVVPMLTNYDHNREELSIPVPPAAGGGSLNLRRNWVNMHLLQRGGKLSSKGSVNGMPRWAGADRQGMLQIETLGQADALMRVDAEINYPSWSPWRGLARKKMVFFAGQFGLQPKVWVGDQIKTVDEKRTGFDTERTFDGRRFAFIFDDTEGTLRLEITPADPADGPAKEFAAPTMEDEQTGGEPEQHGTADELEAEAPAP